MRLNILFSFLAATLAIGYLLLAYTSGSERTRSGDLLAGALLYGPLATASIAALFWRPGIGATQRPWALLLWLCASTALMVGLGYNMAGALAGLVNIILSWWLAVRSIQVSLAKTTPRARG